jgi:hypothetical protein
VTGEWCKLLHNLYSSTGLVTRVEHGREVYEVLVGSPKERDHSEDEGVEGRMGSEWSLGRLAGCVN